MKNSGKAHNKIYITLLIVICLVLFAVLGGVLLNVRKNNLRLAGIDLYGQGQYVEALASFDAGLNQWAPFSAALDLDIMLYKGSTYLLQGNFLGAKNVYEMVVSEKLAPEQAETFRQIASGLQCYVEGKYDETASILTPYAEQGCYELYLYVGSSYLEMGKYEEMMAVFAAYEELGMDSGFMRAEYGAYYIGQGDYENALAQVQAGLAVNDGFQKELRWQEIVCMEHMKDFSAARDKMAAYAKDYTLTEQEQKEWDFLQTR